MKRFGIAGIGAVMGFILALALLPSAQGAPNVLSAYRQLDLFGNAFEQVRANYVREVEDQELIDAAINGMVSSLDPHSSYMNAKEFADMQVDTRGEFGGLGLEVTVEEGLVKVVSPIDDTPAARAGIKAGDYISDIDGMSVQGIPLNDAVAKMRGPSGSRVTLTILRKGERKPFNVTLTRAVIRVANVKYRREGDVGYIRVSQFISERTAADVENAVRALKAQIGPRIKGYIIDLRNNPGGLLDQSVTVSDDFLTGGEVVSTRGRRPGDSQRYNARGGDIADGKPITVLINEGTASASEIVAGALQDHRRATVIGMTSFGKGSVQTIIPLSGAQGGALRLTTAKYYTPSGRSIQAAGIVPDIQVSQLSEKDDTDARFLRSEAELPGHLAAEGQRRRAAQAAIIRPAPGKTYDDFQLSYAIDRMNGKIGMPVAQAPAAAPAPAR
jgi:carboxyl-terminal processing protease